MSFGARALIRLGALEHNLRTIRRAAPEAKVLAVIKANAYGHGMLEVAQALPSADAFGVARIPEATRLRESGIEQPIVLLSGVFDADELRVAIANGFDIVVHCHEQVELLEAALEVGVTLWLKVDTGMNRLGFAPSESAAVIDRLQAANPQGELRLMTHFADADNLDSSYTLEQLERMADVVRDFDGSVSLPNSAALLGWPAIADPADDLGISGDLWIRPGIALYGISPFSDRRGDEFGLKPVMQFESRLVARKPLPAGSHVGYKGRYVSDTDTQIGIISVGYGDGYTRHFRDGTPVMLNGRRVSLIGNVSMDLIAVDLGPDATDRVGDIATLWGGALPVEEVALWADTIAYELVCNVSHREPPQYLP